jgi:hypothetical protein
MYLLKKVKPKVYHLFADGDTVCNLYSSGGLSNAHIVTEKPGVPLCRMCKNKTSVRDVTFKKKPRKKGGKDSWPAAFGCFRPPKGTIYYDGATPPWN